MKEVLHICQKLDENKASGPDGIPNITVECSIRAKHDVFENVYNVYLNEGVSLNVKTARTSAVAQG